MRHANNVINGCQWCCLQCQWIQWLAGWSFSALVIVFSVFVRIMVVATWSLDHLKRVYGLFSGYFDYFNPTLSLLSFRHQKSQMAKDRRSITAIANQLSISLGIFQLNLSITRYCLFSRISISSILIFLILSTFSLSLFLSLSSSRGNSLSGRIPWNKIFFISNICSHTEPLPFLLADALKCHLIRWKWFKCEGAQKKLTPHLN